MKLQQTKDYLLLIDEVARGQKGINWNTALNKLEILHHDYPEHSSEWNYLKLVVAYYPLTKEAKELDLPLLPNPFEEEIDMISLLNKDIPSCFSGVKGHETEDYNKGHRESWIKGYKAAQSKQFSLEDVVRIVHLWDNHINIHKEDKGSVKTIEKFIQSLSTQRLPSEFIPEMESELDAYYRNGVGGACKLKTITNSTGKIELVGTWKY